MKKMRIFWDEKLCLGFFVPLLNVLFNCSIQDAFVPLAGDRVNFKLCPIPPKFMKYQAVEVHLENPDINKHKTWSEHFDAEGNMSTSPVRDPVLSSID